MTKIPAHLLAIFLLIFTFACGESYHVVNYDDEILRAEKVIDSLPDSTLSILQTIDLSRHISVAQCAKIYFLKGKAHRLLLNYPSAMKDLLYAEIEAEACKDYHLLADTRRQIMTLNDSIGNHITYARYALLSADAYKAIMDSDSVFSMLTEAMYWYHSFGDTVKTKEIYHQLVNTFKDSKDPSKQIVLEMSAYDIYPLPPLGLEKRLIDSLNTNGNWEELIACDTLLHMPNSIKKIATNLYDNGRYRLAHDLLECYCKYYTCNIFGTSDGGLLHMTKKFNTPFPFTGTILSRQNFFSYTMPKVERIRADIYYEEIVLKEQTIRHQREMMTVIIICCCLVVCVLLLSLRIIMARRRRREEILIQSAAELNATVNQTNHKWLSTLTHLCDTYYDAYARQSTKSKIAKSALAKINEAIDSAEFFTMLETRLNQEKDGIMNKLRQEMPTLREDEYKLLMLNALGFSIPTLSLLMRENRDLIYTRRVRLRSKIQESAPPHAELFLQALA